MDFRRNLFWIEGNLQAIRKFMGPQPMTPHGESFGSQFRPVSGSFILFWTRSIFEGLVLSSVRAFRLYFDEVIDHFFASTRPYAQGERENEDFNCQDLMNYVACYGRSKTLTGNGPFFSFSDTYSATLL